MHINICVCGVCVIADTEHRYIYIFQQGRTIISISVSIN